MASQSLLPPVLRVSRLGSGRWASSGPVEPTGPTTLGLGPKSNLPLSCDFEKSMARESMMPNPDVLHRAVERSRTSLMQSTACCPCPSYLSTGTNPLSGSTRLTNRSSFSFLNTFLSISKVMLHDLPIT